MNVSPHIHIYYPWHPVLSPERLCTLTCGYPCIYISTLIWKTNFESQSLFCKHQQDFFFKIWPSTELRELTQGWQFRPGCSYKYICDRLLNWKFLERQRDERWHEEQFYNWCKKQEIKGVKNTEDRSLKFCISPQFVKYTLHPSGKFNLVAIHYKVVRNDVIVARK